MSKNKNVRNIEAHSSDNRGPVVDALSIKNDLLWLIGLNALILAILLIVSHLNNQQHFLEVWFSKIFHI